MICYYTHLKVNEIFNQDILLEMFFSWLDNTKNKMRDFSYQGLPVDYHEENKRLKIEDFKENEKLGIQFITKDNYKKSQFIVEIIYSYLDQTLDLGFYKEINDDSKYISAVSIPLIFKNIILSPYIQTDDFLTFQNKPFFISKKEYRQIINNTLELPIVVLYRHKKCCINPFPLSQKLLGIGHVLCVYSPIEQNNIKMIYPDGKSEEIESHGQEYAFINQIAEKIRNYIIQENTQYYSFDDLMNLKLQNEHYQNILSSHEFQQFFQDEISMIEEEIEQLKNQYLLLQQDYQQLEENNQKLEKELLKYNEEAILILDQSDYGEYKQLIENIIQNTINNLADSEKYRKRDVLQSILRRNV